MVKLHLTLLMFFGFNFQKYYIGKTWSDNMNPIIRDWHHLMYIYFSRANMYSSTTLPGLGRYLQKVVGYAHMDLMLFTDVGFHILVSCTLFETYNILGCLFVYT